MAGYAPSPIVQQHVLDALGRWAQRAAGLTVYHGEQNATKPTPPYVAIEWQERPTPESTARTVELIGLPTEATVTLTAAEEEWSAVRVNLAHPGLQRELGETIEDFAVRYAAELAPFLSGRVTVEAAGADLTLTPVNVGDLWLVQSIEHADVVLGEPAPARVRSRGYAGLARVWVIGGAATSGQAGVAGSGAGIMELLSLLAEALSEDWCRELWDQFGVRCGTPEPTPSTEAGRRSNAVRETRAYIDIEIGVSARFGLPPDPIEAVGFSVNLSPDPGVIEGVVVEVQVDAPDAEP